MAAAATDGFGEGRQRPLDVQRHLVAAIDRLRPGHSRRVQIVVQSLGESRPLADNTMAEGRARNRRVEVFLAGPATDEGNERGALFGVVRVQLGSRATCAMEVWR